MAIRNLLFVLLLWGTFFFAMWKGGRSERAAALAMLLGTELTHFAISPYHGRWGGIELGVFFVDLMVFASLFAIGLVSRKYWPMWIAGMQGVVLMAHLSAALPDVIPNAYGNAVQLWSWPMLTMISIATWSAMRDRAASPYPAQSRAAV